MVADFPQPPTQDGVGEPARVIEPYTQVRNALFDARRHLNLAAQSVALTVERYTVGYHRESAVITLPQFAAESGISREGAKIALKELLAKRIIAQDKTGAGRGTVAAYRILPRSCWLIPESIGQLSVPISTQENGQLSVPIDTSIGQLSVPISKSIGQLSSPLIKKEKKKEKREKEIPVGEAQAPRLSPVAAPRKRQRKLTDEQLAAHQLEAQYVSDLIAAVRARIKVKGALPTEGRERQAAHWFYREGAPIETVLRFYETMKLSSFWVGKYLSLAHVEGPYSEHQGDVAAYQTAEAMAGARSGRHGSGPSGTGAPQRGAGGATGAGTAESQRLKAKYAGVAAASDKRLLGNGPPPG